MPSDPALPGPAELLAWTVRILVIATDIITMEEPQALAVRVKDALVTELGFPIVSILLADADQNLTYAADHGISDQVKALGFRKGGLAYTAFQTGQASFVEDVARDRRANPKSLGLLGSFAALPIHHRGRSYGVIMVTSLDQRLYSDLERVTLTAFAHSLGIALDNARLHHQERQRIAFLSAQADLAAALSATLNTTEVVRILGATVQGMDLAEGVAVWLRRDLALELGFCAGFHSAGEAAPMSMASADSRVLAALGQEATAFVPQADLSADLGLSRPLANPQARVFALPLRHAGVQEGLLVFLCAQASFDPALVEAMGERAALALHNARLYEDSLAMASHDALTGLSNRRGFMESARSLTATACRFQAPLSLIMVDADLFKACNDTYGHAAGDRVLVLLAQILGAQTRPTDLVGRLGGEEFAICLPNSSQEIAFRVAERIRLAMEAATLDLGPDGPKPVPTVSLGVTDLSALQVKDLDHLLESADQALYQAKHEGRNRTCRAT